MQVPGEEQVSKNVACMALEWLLAGNQACRNPHDVGMLADAPAAAPIVERVPVIAPYHMSMSTWQAGEEHANKGVETPHSHGDTHQGIRTRREPQQRTAFRVVLLDADVAAAAGPQAR